jgi:UDP-2,3-diacylglucosamine hydrolase
MHSIFVSDLHLSPARPGIVDSFLGFVADTAARAEALYVLGDLFDYWVGDDDLAEAFNTRVCDALAGLARSGVRLGVMHGNRDLLLGQAFAQRCGAKLLDDPVEVDLYGTRTLLMHGDTLCIDDLKYQKWRTYARDPETQRKFLAQPLAQRWQQMRGLREDSERDKQEKTEAIMDVAPVAVESVLRSHGYPRLIHGHTHRPARHVHRVDGRQCERWVLPDWYERGGYLRCDAAGCAPVIL